MIFYHRLFTRGSTEAWAFDHKRVSMYLYVNSLANSKLLTVISKRWRQWVIIPPLYCL